MYQFLGMKLTHIICSFVQKLNLTDLDSLKRTEASGETHRSLCQLNEVNS
jgi:hypothetical protein